MRNHHGSKPSINVVLPQELLDRLDAICKERLVGRSIVIQRAIEELVGRLERSEGI